MEVSSLRFYVIYGEDGYKVNTNNYLSQTMCSIENSPEDLVNSRVRYFRALGLLKRTPRHTVKSLQAIQSDHVNYPDSICNHSIEARIPLDDEKTINALILDLTTREMHIVWGSPCVNPYHTFHLNA